MRSNLGGEGEVAGVLNQQGRWVVRPGWASSRRSQTFRQLVAAGHRFLIADNDKLPLPDGCCDEVLPDSVPLDITTQLGPGVQTSEIRRILKSGGQWVHEGVVQFIKP
jgi:hypothetical protein